MLAPSLALALALASPLVGEGGWSGSGQSAIRGVTIGPIENGYHPGRGYGTDAFDRTLLEVRDWGGGWVAITPFGRVGSLAGVGVDRTFEAPFEENRAAIAHAIDMAHARGLKVMLVPHLWVETKEWRAKIDPKTDDGWARWAQSYGDFVRTWAEVAEERHVEIFSAGVELRSWVTGGRATSFLDLIASVRTIYHGLVTYSANWADVDDTIILGALDLIGINAFYPLADRDNATTLELLAGGERVRAKVHALAETWHKPVLFTEIGYTTRPNPAIKPWEWPDDMTHVRVDEGAQALAYHALVKPLLDEPYFAGFFVWRVYSDPEDVSQEAEWGFSPRGKLAENVIRDAFSARWASDGEWERRALGLRFGW
ncbi:hypothetical protein BH09MYX1_BH09MYX1_36190 [soil metagenome]